MKQVDKNILDLAVPSIVSNVTVPLLGLVDLAIVGHMGSEQYIAAIAVGSMIFNVIYWLFGFLRMGTSGMTSQALGRADHGSIKLLFRRSLSVALVIAGCFVVMQIPLRWLALTVIHPSEQIWPLASTYFNILIWGAPAMLGLYSLNGWFIGLQNTKIPMMVAIFQNVVNIVASLFFVFVLGMRIAGVALGTLVAQWSGFALALWMARRQFEGDEQLRRAEARAGDESVTWSSFFVVNRDIFLRTLCLVGVNLFFTSAGARQGDMMLAVNTLLMTFFTLFSYVMDGFAFAGEALSGKLYGAGDRVGLRHTIGRLFVWGMAMVVAFTTVYVVGGNSFLRLITNDERVIQASGEYFFWACMIPVAGMAAFVYDGIFIGLTATRGMLVSSFVATIAFFALFFLGIQRFAPNHVLWLSLIVYLLSRGLLQHVLIRKRIKI
ncbi:MAG: MATE family efflux transporter [Prevotella sp.]|nr:MATE family efflux transporter [Prevotella sp.]